MINREAEISATEEEIRAQHPDFILKAEQARELLRMQTRSAIEAADLVLDIAGPPGTKDDRFLRWIAHFLGITEGYARQLQRVAYRVPPALREEELPFDAYRVVANAPYPEYIRLYLGRYREFRTATFPSRPYAATSLRKIIKDVLREHGIAPPPPRMSPMERITRQMNEFRRNLSRFDYTYTYSEVGACNEAAALLAEVTYDMQHPPR